jgi:hypothetical protein
VSGGSGDTLQRRRCGENRRLPGDAHRQGVVVPELTADLDLGEIVVAQELGQGLDEVDIGVLGSLAHIGLFWSNCLLSSGASARPSFRVRPV